MSIYLADHRLCYRPAHTDPNILLHATHIDLLLYAPNLHLDGYLYLRLSLASTNYGESLLLPR